MFAQYIHYLLLYRENWHYLTIQLPWQRTVSLEEGVSSSCNNCNNKIEETTISTRFVSQMGRVKRIWYLSPMRAAKVQAILRIRAVSPEPPLLAHISSKSRGTFIQKASSLSPLNGWACAVKICHDGMLEDTNSLDASQMMVRSISCIFVNPLTPSGLV